MAIDIFSLIYYSIVPIQNHEEMLNQKRPDLDERFLNGQYLRIQARIGKYTSVQRIEDELLSGNVSPYTLYKQRALIPILNKVLNLIATGEYGICKSCGKPIETKRLKIVPAATECLECIKKAPHR